MAPPRKISQEQYEQLRSTIEKNYGYDKMSEADRAVFDRIFDETVVAEPENSGEMGR